MNQNLAEIVCILDRSGSMEAIRTDAIGSFNSFLAEQKKHPGQAALTLVLFNQRCEMVRDHVDLQEVLPLDEQTYVPGGVTALLDAIGRTIDEVGRHLKRLREEDRPGKVIVSILTDGLENASREYGQAQVSAMIRHQQEKYGWEFLFLAANQDAIATASTLSIPAQDAYTFEASSEGIKEAGLYFCQAIMEKRNR